MGDPTWELLPRVGIENGATKICFGMERDVLRDLLSRDFAPPHESDFPDEDDFSAADESTQIRVRYDGTVVKDIEFLAGVLKYRGTDLHARASFAAIAARLATMGFAFRPTEWLGDGQDCQGLGINVATREDVGGDGDDIEWVIMSSDFE